MTTVTAIAPDRRHPADLLSPKQAAADYGMSENWLAQRRMRGNGPKFVKFGASVKYPRSEFDAFIAANTFESTSAAQR